MNSEARVPQGTRQKEPLLGSRQSLEHSLDNNPSSLLTSGHSKGHVEKSNKKLYAVIALFLLSLFSFVSQTELTTYLYNELGFNQPYLLLMLTHGSWTLIWPSQVIAIAIFKHFKKAKRAKRSPWNRKLFSRHFKDSVRSQHKNIFKTSGTIIEEYYIEESDFPTTIKEFVSAKSILYIAKCILLLTLILNLAGCTWYVAMGIAPASDITAIYNCSAFTALIFAIPILREKFTYVKLSSVLLALLGVFFVAYSGSDSTEGSKEFPYRFWGDLTIAIGAIFYGLYEVLYKKLVCPSPEDVSAKRQVAFSNFCASLIGLSTLSTLWILVLLVDIFGISKFSFAKSLYEVIIMGASIISNLVFSLSFLALMSLTSPVLSSVSSLVTILFVGFFEWVLFGVKLTFQQLIGDLFIVVGFVVLSYSYWNEITEEEVDDDEGTDIESIQSSIN